MTDLTADRISTATVKAALQAAGPQSRHWKGSGSYAATVHAELLARLEGDDMTDSERRMRDAIRDLRAEAKAMIREGSPIRSAVLSTLRRIEEAADSK